MHQSGTHWLKHMLAAGISHQYQIPMSAKINQNEIIGGPKDPVIFDNIPKLAASHTIPHPLFYSRHFRTIFNFPCYVVLVRDMRSTLIANFQKWRDLYACEFSEYLKDFSRKKVNNEIWWCIRFMNAWGRALENYPEKTRLLRYEDLQADTFGKLSEVSEYLSLGLKKGSLEFAVEQSTRESMQQKDKPDLMGSAGVIGKHNLTHEEAFSAEDLEFLNQLNRKYLKYSFGYKYI